MLALKLGLILLYQNILQKAEFISKRKQELWQKTEMRFCSSIVSEALSTVWILYVLPPAAWNGIMISMSGTSLNDTLW